MGLLSFRSEKVVEQKEQIVKEILFWWDAGHAEMPWRRNRDPYAIWVAEVMLQQTQISTVIPFYQRWMDRFPTIAELAGASLDEVLKAWEGLGYYSRARNMHAAAQMIMQDYDGQIPTDVANLMKLKGIGRYTAGAIASIAFDKRAPVVDGNVTRVLCRLQDLTADISKANTKKLLWFLADDLVPATRPGAFNQALMELGQTICRPVDPRCHECPLAHNCKARRLGTQLDRPVRPARKRLPHYDVTAGVIRGENRQFLITRRPLDGLLGGLWEFPGGKQEKNETLVEALIREIWEELAIQIDVGQPIATIKHAYTHYRISLHAFHAQHLSGEPRHIGVTDHAWVGIDDLDSYPFAVTDLKIIEYLRADY